MHFSSEPSDWVRRWAHLIPPGGEVLDLACGAGRHTRLFADLGHPVTAVDRDPSRLGDLADRPEVTALEVDLEDGRPFPFPPDRFAGVIVANYLHRPILEGIVAAVSPGGALIYETFSAGNERVGGVRRPEFVLRPGELFEVVRARLRVAAYEDLLLEVPRPRVVQRVAAVRAEQAPPG